MPSAVSADPIFVATRLRPVLLKLNRELRREIHFLGVTGGQVSLLIQIQKLPGMGVRELATRERMSVPGMSKYVARLESAGLIRKTELSDKRRVGIVLTEEGHRVAHRAPAQRRAARARRNRRSHRASPQAPRRGHRPVTAMLLRGGRRTFLSLRKHRNYRLFFTGQVVSVSGTWMQNVAMYWLVLQLTHSPLAVGILSLCRFGPFTLFGLQAGVIADRLDNRKTVIFTQSVQMVLSGILAVDALADHVTAWHVYAIAALTGTALVLDAPARQSLTFQMVGRAELPNAVALNSTLFNIARIAGPALGGVVI